MPEMNVGRVRYLTNCLFVAAAIWFSTRGRSWVAKRRSLYFRGLIPHFSVFIGKGDSIYQVEYVPPVEDGDVGVNYVALFDGYFQVKVWQKTGSGRSKTLLGAWRTAKRQAAVAHSRPHHVPNPG